VISQVANLT